MDPQDDVSSDPAALPPVARTVRPRSHSSPTRDPLSSPDRDPSPRPETPAIVPESDQPLDMRVSRPRRPRRQMMIPGESTTPQGSPPTTPRLRSAQPATQSTPNRGQSTQARQPQSTPRRRRHHRQSFASSPPIQDPLGRLGSMEQECWGLENSPTRANRIQTDTSGWNFEIYEDPPDRASPHPPTPPPIRDPDEDKENIYATASDYESDHGEVVEENVQGVDFERVNEFTQNAFGPVDTGPLRSLRIDERGRVRRSITGGRVPLPTAARVRPALRIGVTDEEEAFDSWEPEWVDELDLGQMRELRQLGMNWLHGVDQRHAHGSQYPLRDNENIQGPTNIFHEARRITEVQRNPDRFQFADEGDNAGRASRPRRIVRRRNVGDDEDENMADEE